jgi:hypothetical protein
LVLRPKLGVGAAHVTAGVRVEGIYGEVSDTGLALTVGGAALLDWGPLLMFLEARYTSLSIDTEAVKDIPGLFVEDQARLDGLLFALGGGLTF